MSLNFINGRLQILDQYQLPKKEVWVDVLDPDVMVDCIKQLKVRGAPLIGVSAALSLAQYTNSGANIDEFMMASHKLRNSRPTAVNLMNCLDRMIGAAEKKFEADNICSQAIQIFDEDVELCQNIANHGQTLIEDGDKILTHCNTGGLATVGVGTALGILAEAKKRGKNIFVWVDETRPLLQGARLTTWELEKLEIPYKLICDNMAASLMRNGEVNKVILGSDRIASNGDFANKIGSYSLAVLCQHHSIPYYVAAPYTTIDYACKNGNAIPIEQRASKEVRGASGSFGEVSWAPHSCAVYNPAFDVVPKELVTAWILDHGCFEKEQINNGDFLRR